MRRRQGVLGRGTMVSETESGAGKSNTPEWCQRGMASDADSSTKGVDSWSIGVLNLNLRRHDLDPVGHLDLAGILS